MRIVFAVAITIGITVGFSIPAAAPTGATVIITGGSSGSIRTTSTYPTAEEAG